MKKNSFSKIIAAALLVGTPLCWTACSDAWDDHYGVQDGGMADQPSLLENIKSDASLANFARVLEAIGQDEVLGSAQQLTVWAPKNLTSAQADSIIAVYEADKAAGRRIEDNRAITQFFQNHVALYARSISSLTDDTVSMLNKKYMHLVGETPTKGTISGYPFNEMVLSNNGILYKTENMLTFFPNLREYLDQMQNGDSIASMLARYDEYELDEKASVAGGIRDGKTFYLDSVTTLRNTMLNRLDAYIQREDSVYSVIVPTDELWEKQYNQYKDYYKYSSIVPLADSLTEANTRMSIISGRIFNTSGNIRYNRAPEDSLVNTMYGEMQSHNPRRNVYYKPFSAGGIFDGLQKVQCSNGEAYIDNKGVIDPRTTFFVRNDIPAYFGSYYEVEKDNNNEDKMNTETRGYYDYKYIEQYNEETEEMEKHIIDEKMYSYLRANAKVSTQQTEIAYLLPQVLSDVYYNIYVVTVPAMSLPTWFQVGHAEMREDGSFQSVSNKISYTMFENPHPVQADGTLLGIPAEKKTVNDAETILKQSKNNTCFVSSTEKIDTILVQAAVQFPYSNVGWGETVARLKVQSFGPSNSTIRDKIYTRTLNINEIILVPFETAEEAMKAADDTDAFNDELLEAEKNANKE